MNRFDEGKKRVGASTADNAKFLEDLAKKRDELKTFMSGKSNRGVKPSPPRSSAYGRAKKERSHDDGQFVNESDDEYECEDSDEPDEKMEDVVEDSSGAEMEEEGFVEPVLLKIAKKENGSVEYKIASEMPLNTLQSTDDEEMVVNRAGGKKRKIAISSSEDDATCKKETVKEPKKDKKKIKKVKKAKRSASDDDLGDKDFHNNRSSDSEGGGSNKKSSYSDIELKQKTLQFFNEADPSDLRNAPRVSEKIAVKVLALRPFRSFFEFQEALHDVTRGAAAIDAYFELLQSRGIIEKVLDDCLNTSKEIQNKLESMTKSEIIDQPKSLHVDCKLHDYQKIGLNWLIQMHKLRYNSVLGDEMGLGKTLQIIAFLTYLKETGTSGPHLIVVPSSVIETWLAEIEKFSPTLKVLSYYGTMDERRQLRKEAYKGIKNLDVLLTTYNMITSREDDRKFFKVFTINYVIYDEGHMLKNCNSQRYRSLMKVKGKSKILLTGTPLQNNLIELISLLYFIMSKMFLVYCEDIDYLLNQFQVRVKGGTKVNTVVNFKEDILNEGNAENEEKVPLTIDEIYESHKIDQAKLILAPFMLRRLKTNVLKLLPKKTEEIKFVDMVPLQVEMYEQCIESMKELVAIGEGGSVSGLMQLRQVANHPLLYRWNYTDTKCHQISQQLVQHHETYRNKNPIYVAETLAFMNDIQIHKICLACPETYDFCLSDDYFMNSGKFNELQVLLKNIRERKEKVLIFSQFTSLLDILEVFLEIQDYPFTRLDGSTPVMERFEMVEEFNKSKDAFIFTLSTKAGGLGINLTSANNVIIHDIDFNPYNDKQAEDRVHRFGQLKEVNVYRLISKDTVEESMLVSAQNKLKLEKNVTGIEEETEEDTNLDNKTVEMLIKSAFQKTPKRK
uniref:Helicase ATP-binding domain-containing protein n=1 Tax=Rhabditophanes sp. KR3021 TaxID=114890 RepID=A0AC35TSX2_9BILA